MIIIFGSELTLRCFNRWWKVIRKNNTNHTFKVFNCNITILYNNNNNNNEQVLYLYYYTALHVILICVQNTIYYYIIMIQSEQYKGKWEITVVFWQIRTNGEEGICGKFPRAAKYIRSGKYYCRGAPMKVNTALFNQDIE